MNSKIFVYTYFVRFPLVLSIVLMVILGVFAKRGVLDWNRMSKQNREIGTRIAGLRDQRETLASEIDSLRRDPLTQEKVVRQNLGYVKKNETVIEFD